MAARRPDLAQGEGWRGAGSREIEARQVGDAAGEAKAILLPRRPWHQQGPTGGRGAGDADGEAQLRSGDSGVEEEDAALANEGGQQRRSLVQRPTLDRELLSRSGVRGARGLAGGAAWVQLRRGLEAAGEKAHGSSLPSLSGGVRRKGGSRGAATGARGVEAVRGDRARGSGAGGERGRDGDRWESG